MKFQYLYYMFLHQQFEVVFLKFLTNNLKIFYETFWKHKYNFSHLQKIFITATPQELLNFLENRMRQQKQRFSCIRKCINTFLQISIKLFKIFISNTFYNWIIIKRKLNIKFSDSWKFVLNTRFKACYVLYSLLPDLATFHYSLKLFSYIVVQSKMLSNQQQNKKINKLKLKFCSTDGNQQTRHVCQPVGNFFKNNFYSLCSNLYSIQGWKSSKMH